MWRFSGVRDFAVTWGYHWLLGKSEGFKECQGRLEMTWAKEQKWKEGHWSWFSGGTGALTFPGRQESIIFFFNPVKQLVHTDVGILKNTFLFSFWLKKKIHIYTGGILK